MSVADEMRAAFDRAFAAAPAEHAATFEDFIGIGVGGRPFALRLREIAGFFTDRPVTPLASPVLGLAGLAGFRGATVPVYDLRALLGLSTGEVTRWMVLVAGKQALALSFERFDGHFRVATDAIAGEPPQRPGESAGEVIRIGDEVRPVVHLGAIVDGIRNRARPSQHQQTER